MLFQIDNNFEEKYIQLNDSMQLVVAESRRTLPDINYSAEMQWSRLLMKRGLNFYFAGYLKPNSKSLDISNKHPRRANFK
jgi:hypothetical protein